MCRDKDWRRCRPGRVWCICMCHMRDSDLPGLSSRRLCQIEVCLAAGMNIDQARAVVPAASAKTKGTRLFTAHGNYRRDLSMPFIQMLPNELLCEIFLLCGDHNEKFDYPRPHYIKDSTAGHPFSLSAMRLGYVCSRWFRVTRNCPSLWTLVDLRRLRSREVAVLRLCLQYSSGLPLALRVHLARSHAKTIRVDAFERLMMLVAKNSVRWKDLSIFIAHPSCGSNVHPVDGLKPLFEVPDGAFAALERAAIELEGYTWHNPSNRELWMRVYTSSHLHTLEWWNDPYYLNAATAPLHQLTHIGAKGLQPKLLPDLLRRCPQLEVLEATLQADLPDFWIPDSEQLPAGLAPITLKRLRILMLLGLDDYSRLYACMFVPALDRLELCSSGVQAEAIADMLRRSGAEMRMLTLHGPSIGWADDMKVLLHLPAMQSVDIVYYAPGEGCLPVEDAETMDLSPHVPPRISVFTSEYEVAEQAYRELCGSA
ncbi:hypothetical protein EV121DRAFT_271977 [Schizophyllum commune]